MIIGFTLVIEKNEDSIACKGGFQNLNYENTHENCSYHVEYSITQKQISLT